MVYLSQLLGKTVYQNNKPFGKIIDMAVVENRPNPPVSKIEIRHNKEKLTISPQALRKEKEQLILVSHQIPFLPYDHKDFYLVEDLLDKQVIDTDGRRLVRVNDVILDDTDEIKVVGIDIGFGGILRRLGLGGLATKTTVLPWSVIEAFDYQTGDVRIKLKQSSLNTLHPADLADILEGVGTKERVGIVEALDARKAARAIEETDDQTQVSILESLEPSTVESIVKKMHISEIADVINDLNPLKVKEVQKALGDENTQKVRKLLSFSDDVAGGMMHLSFLRFDGNVTVKQALQQLDQLGFIPEAIIITNGNEKIIGTIYTKDLLLVDRVSLLKDLVSDKKFVYPHTSLSNIIQLVSQYNLRSVPVVDADKKPIGIVLIDDILRIIEEENEKDENI